MATSFRRQQLESRGDEATGLELPRHPRVPDGIAETIRRMRITKRINVHSLHEVAAPLNSHCQIAALARQVQAGDWAACGMLSPMPRRPYGWPS